GALARSRVGRVAVVGSARSASPRVPPVGPGRAAARLLRDHEPLAVLHVGLAAGRARIALERVAVNVMDYECPDNAGYQARGEPCEAGGPPAYFATLPLGAILEALAREAIPAYLSNTAGTYLCNH